MQQSFWIKGVKIVGFLWVVSAIIMDEHHGYCLPLRLCRNCGAGDSIIAGLPCHEEGLNLKDMLSMV